MRISVIVPVYNEEKTVARVLDQLARVELDMEVVVVDDASTDSTWDVLQQLRQQEPFTRYRYVRHSHNQGKGTGLRTGFRMVSGDLVTIQDADLEYDPTEYYLLLKPILNGKADVVYGSRFSGAGPHRARSTSSAPAGRSPTASARGRTAPGPRASGSWLRNRR